MSKNYVERLDREVAESVKKSLGQGGMDLSNPKKARIISDQMSARLVEQRTEFRGVVSEDRKIPGLPEGTELDARVYQAENRTGLSPVLLWMPGGGYVVGDVELDDLLCRQLTLAGECVVVAVNYRRAPEYPYPIPLEDCYTALKWLATQADELRINLSCMCVGGASAGGGLSAGLALLARDRGEIKLAWQLLLYPMIDDRNTALPSKTVPDTLVWTRKDNYYGWRAYLGHEPGTGEVEPYASPARAINLEELPPAFIGTGDLDLFAEESLGYAQRLVAAGVPTEIHMYPGVPHGFDGILAPQAEISKKFRNDIMWAFKRICNK
ncbi:MAG: alpha/beta hydrolase [Dehalococcoidales bacterium]|nr:alpha/beta hydrolase [Dehalococcoidales bacterium]